MRDRNSLKPTTHETYLLQVSAMVFALAGWFCVVSSQFQCLAPKFSAGFICTAAGEMLFLLGGNNSDPLGHELKAVRRSCKNST